MPRRIDLGRALLFAGSALLFISLFLEWYDPDISGWEVFEALDLALASLAVAGIVAALRPDLLPPWTGIAIPAAAFLIVFVQLVDGPPASGGEDPSSGAWIALAGSLLMAAGAALTLAAISITVQVRERDVRRRVAAVDRRDDAAAEDLDADADAPRGGRSLFGSLGRRDEERDDVLGDAPPAPGSAGATVAPSAGAAHGGGTADPERTQPLPPVRDPDEEDPGRP